MNASPRDWALLEERLSFLANQHDALLRFDDRIEIVAARPELATVIPLMATRFDPAWPSVTLLPWVALDWDERLRAAGFVRDQPMAFLERPTDRAIEIREIAGLTVERVGDEDGADLFAAIQAECFPFVSKDDPQSRHAYFRGRILHAMRRPGSVYLLARVGGEPRAITMVQLTGEVAGIYLVGTRANARGQGLATILLREAQSIALAAGCSSLKLQAQADGAAYGIYTRSGFVERFRTAIWRKPTG